MSNKYLDADGCLTFWVSSDGVSREALRKLVDAEEILCCRFRPKQPLSALRRACHEALDQGAWLRATRSTHHLVRPLRKGAGYAVVEETAPGEADLSHRQLGHVLYLKQEQRLEFSGGCPQSFADAVTDGFKLHLDLLSRSSLSDFYASVLQRQLQATGLRPAGGLWQFRETHYDTWQSLVTKVEDCVVTGRKMPEVYTLRHSMDEQAAAAILAGLRREIRQRAAELKEEVSGGRLGARGKASRRDEAYRLKEKVAATEALLSASLPELHEQLSEVAALAGGLEVLAAVEAASA